MQFHNKPFDLKPGADRIPRRVAIIRFDSGRVGLKMVASHMLEDGGSYTALLKLILHSYYDRVGLAGALPTPQEMLPYAVYVEHEAQYLRSTQYRTDRSYWEKKLEGILPVGTDLFGGVYQGTLAQDVGKFEAESYNLSLPSSANCFELARKYGLEHGASQFQVLLAAYYWALHVATGKSDLVVSTSFHGRVTPDLKRVNGNCVNLLPLRQEVVADMTFAQLVEQVRANVRTSKRHGQFPFAELQSKQAAFEYMFSCYDLDNMMSMDHDTVVNPCTVRVITGKETTEVYVAYQKKVLSADSMKALVQLWLQVLEQAVSNPSKTLSMLDLLTAEQKQAILQQSCGPVLSPLDQRYDRLFDVGLLQDGLSRPADDKLAVRCGDESLTYGDLRSLSDSLACVLRHHDSKIVAVHMPKKSAFMIPLLLGVLKADAVFMPLDSSLPLSRMETMLQNCGASLVVSTEPETFEGLEGVEVLAAGTLEAQAQGLEPIPRGTPHPLRLGTSEELSYILHTSGTTGVPKAVPIRHSSLVNYCRSMIRHYALTMGSNMLQCSAEGFDIFIEEVFPVLLAGGSIEMIQKQVLLSEDSLRQTVTDAAVTHMTISTSLFHAISDFQLPGLEAVVVGGEKLKKQQYERFQLQHPDTAVYNTYGPTETTVIASLHKCELNTESELPIGKPIHGTRIYVQRGQSGDEQLCPVGVAGEVYIGGAGVSPGYLGPNAKNEAFAKDALGGMMFRTGDLARWRPDGNLEFVSRVGKGQVKIRGYRVEIGDVTKTLLEADGVSDCYVLPVTRSDTDSSETELAAFVVWEAAETESSARFQLRREVTRKLPGYMVPSCFIPLDRLPLTAFGKIDEKSLQETYSEWSSCQNSLQEAGDKAEPRNDAERDMVQIWKEVLNVDQLGIDDDFFELGGTSFLALRLVSLCKGSFQVADLFQTPTIRELMEPVNVPTCLIPLRQPVKPRHLAFCLPGFGGNARALSEAAGATFAADVAIFGIQPKGLVNAALDPPLEDLGDMIQQTCSVVQQAVASVDFEPDSITLFGYSAGTLLALGVADALKDTVSKVVLIAPGSPTFLPADETPRKCDDLYQDLRYTSLVLSLFLAPQGLDVMAVAETVKSKEDFVEAVKKAGLSDQAVRPFLPYFEARYKSQKDLDLGSLRCGSSAEFLVVKCEGDDYTGFDELVEKNTLKVQTHWCEHDHFGVLAAPFSQWRRVQEFVATRPALRLSGAFAPHQWGREIEKPDRRDLAYMWTSKEPIRAFF